MQDFFENLKLSFERRLEMAKYRFDVFKNYTLKKSFVVYAIDVPAQIYDFLKDEVLGALLIVEKKFAVIPRIARRITLYCAIFVLTVAMVYGVYRLVPSQDQRGIRFYNRATQFYARGMYPEAAVEYKNAIMHIPRSADAHYQLANTYIYLSRLKDAAGEFFRCIQINPQRSDAINKFNAVTTLLDDPAYKDLKEDGPLKRGARFIPGRTLMAKILVYSGDNINASVEAGKLYEDTPDSLGLNIIMGDISLSNNDPESANNYYSKALAIDENSFDARFKMGALHISQNEINKALEELFKALKLSAENPLVYTAIGDCFVRQSQYEKAIEYYKKAYSLNNKFTRAVEGISNILIYQGRIVEARPFIEELYKVSPNSPTTLLYKAITLFSENKTEESLDNIKKSIEISGGSFQSHYIYARMLAVVGKLDESKDEYKTTIKLNANILEPHLELVDIYIRLNDLERAQEEAERARAINADDIRAFAAQGMVQLLKKNYDGADEYFADIVKRYPAKPDGYFYLGLIDQSKGDLDEAEVKFAAALGKEINYSNAFYALIKLYMNAGEYQKAVNLCEKMLKAGPQNAAIYEILGNIFAALNRNDEAIGFYEKAVDINPRLVSARAGLARQYLSKNMSLNALLQYEDILRISPKDRQAALYVASIYQDRGDNAKAAEYFEKALKLGFDYALANDLARYYVGMVRNLDWAMELALRAEKASNNAARVVDTVGLVLLKKGDYDEAIERFRKCVEKRDDEPVYKYHLGLALYMKGVFSEACKYFKAALSLSKEFDGAGEAKKLVEELRARGIE